MIKPNQKRPIIPRCWQHGLLASKLPPCSMHDLTWIQHKDVQLLHHFSDWIFWIYLSNYEPISTYTPFTNEIYQQPINQSFPRNPAALQLGIPDPWNQRRFHVVFVCHFCGSLHFAVTQETSAVFDVPTHRKVWNMLHSLPPWKLTFPLSNWWLEDEISSF